MPILSNAAPSITTPTGITLAVASVDPRRVWVAVTTGSANFAHGEAFRVPRPVLVSQVTFHVQAQNGNIDIGLYQGENPITKLTSTGSIACPGIGVSTQALTGTVALVPGVRYWAVWTADGTTAALYGISPTVASTALSTAKAAGNVSLGAFPLPSSTLTLGYSIVGRFPHLVFS